MVVVGGNRKTTKTTSEQRFCLGKQRNNGNYDILSTATTASVATNRIRKVAAAALKPSITAIRPTQQQQKQQKPIPP